MSSSAPLKKNDEPPTDEPIPDDDWSTVSKGKTLKPSHPPNQPKLADDVPPPKLCWASLFETPRASPLSRPKSPEVNQSAALKVIASVEPIVVSWKQLQVACRMRSRGMHNNGNMCFLNSVLQSLIFCAPLANLLRSIPLKLLESLEVPYLFAFASLFAEFYETLGKSPQSNDTTAPSKLLDVLWNSHVASFRGDQEDAQEFLTFVLDRMHEEFSQNKELLNWEFSETTENLFKAESLNEEEGWMEVDRKQRISETRTMAKTETPISFLFAGQFRSTVRRPKVKDSITFEPFNCLPLEVHHRQIVSLEDSLMYLARPETISIGLTKNITIGRLPMILIIQLKRFVYNKDSGRIEKVGKYVSYPEKLVIPRACHPGENRPTYRLFAAVFHHGQSAEGGHYTVDVRKSFKHDELWQRINDSNISSVPLEQVLADRKRDASAYLLFYQRMKDTKHDL